MLISTSPNFRTFARPQQPSKPVEPSAEEERLPPSPVLEQTAAGAILGASVGTLMGGQIGRHALVAGGVMGGYHLGNSFAPGWGGPVGAVLGLAGTHTAERYLHLGETAGATVGFLTGSLVGGGAGALVGSFEHLLEWGRNRTS